MNAKAEFDEHSESYDRSLNAALSTTGEDKNYFAEQRVVFMRTSIASIQIKVERILDFGCGTGSATPFLLKAFPGARIVGVDVSEKSIEIARRDHGIEYVEFHALPADGQLDIGKFDLAFTNGVFHHILPVERDGWMKWILARTSKAGVFFLFENNPWNPGTRYVMSNCVFDQDAIMLSYRETKTRLEDAGFDTVSTRFLFFFPRLLRALRGMESVLARLPLGGQYVCIARP